MDQPLRIAFIASECAPFAKTGGLADVVGTLPGILRALGHETIIIIPRYRFLKSADTSLTRRFSMLGVWMGNTVEWCAVDETRSGDVPVYCIEMQKYFDRDGLYHDERFNDYGDNAYRFGFFTRAALQFLIDSRFYADIVHVHDWQTALAPAYLKIWHWNHHVLGRTATVLTIHNIAYQGVYPLESYDYLGLQWSNFTSEKFEDHGRINFLKGGIHYSDMITTVSPGYARETRTPEYAFGMAPYLNDRGDSYQGILNGVDYSIWNPEVDSRIPANFSATDMIGKRRCKAVLQQRMGMTENPDVMLIGVVSRLVSQKGLQILTECLPRIMDHMQVQWVILGSGDPAQEDFFRRLPARYPGQCGVYIGYDDELAHWIEAGSDAFMMPSLYEPCGLNQMYSLRYGTLPIVRATGGLDDTVDQYDEMSGNGTGFKFSEPTPDAIYYTVGWAVSTWYDRQDHYRKMQVSAMGKNFSWDRSAREYLDVYARAIQRKP